MAIGKSKSLICALAVGCGALTLIGRPSARATTTTFTFGGSADDVPQAVAVDADSNVYVAGSTRSRDLPGTQQAYQKQLRGFGDAFVAKFDPNNRLVWTTYLGGSDAAADQFGVSGEQATAVGVDPQGNVYVGGLTTSSDFPTINAYQSSRRSTGLLTDGFLSKLDSNGGRLIYSTYLGAPPVSSRVNSISVGPAGDVWVGINAPSSQFPVTRDLSTSGVGPGVVARFQSSGMPVWLTRVGSLNSEFGSMAVDPFGQPTMAIGNTVIQLDPSGSHINYTWSVPNAPPGSSAASYIAAGADGTIAVVGGPASDVPVKNAWQTSRDPAGNGFLALLGPRGLPDVVTYLPGAASGIRRVAVDPSGGVHLAFDSQSPTLSPLGGSAVPHAGSPVFASIDRGDSWTWASQGLYGGTSLFNGVFQLAIDSIRRYMYALAPSGVFRSVDQGSTWSLWAPVPGTSPISNGGMALDPRDPTTLYYGSNDLWRVDQDGRTQTLLRTRGAGVAGFRVDALAVSPYDSSVWVASGNGLEVSFDRGATWAHRDRGFTVFSDRVNSPSSVIFDRQIGTMFATFGGDFIFRTTDSGLTWQRTARVGTSPGADMLAIDPAVPDRLYAADHLDGILVTEDAGRSWRNISPNLPGSRAAGRIDVRAISVSPIPPYQVYAVAQGLGQSGATIITSVDRGETWFAARKAYQRSVPTRLLADPTDRDRVFSAAATIGSEPFVMRMDHRDSGPRYSPSLASVFPQQSVGAIAATLDGQTVIAFKGSDINVVRIGR